MDDADSMSPKRLQATGVFRHLVPFDAMIIAKFPGSGKSFTEN